MADLTVYQAPKGFIAYHSAYALKLPEGHRFPMAKYDLIPEALVYEGVVTEDAFFVPQELDEAVALLTHTEDYWRRMKALQLTEREMRAIGFPLSEALITRSCRIARGSVECALHALAHKAVALNTAGGTHHSFADHGEGFCILNDFAITANYLLHTGKAARILIVDLDVHQGNGTASILREEPRVFTFSMHGQHNYPFRKEESDLDIGLADGISGTEYLSILERTLPRLLDDLLPDIVLYLAGVDVLATDRYGKMMLTQHDCYLRDYFVFNECQKRNLPVAVSMGGGYSPEVRHIVAAHVGTYKAALSVYG